MKLNSRFSSGNRKTSEIEKMKIIWIFIISVLPYVEPQLKFENSQEFLFGASSDSQQEDIFLNSRGCGENTRSKNRIVGGRPAQVGSWPWMALLLESDDKVFFCGGALVSRRHVVTAAHCVTHRNPNTLLVRFMEYDLTSQADGPHLDVNVATYIVHPGYSDINHANDVAIVILQSPIPFGERLRPVCLPASLDWRSRDLTGKRGTVIGFGLQSFTEGTVSPVLREVDVQILPSAGCREAYSRFKNVRITPAVVCAGDPQGGKDACRGDSGGPLMFEDGDQYFLIGVVSTGHRCGEAKFPGVYTNIAKFADWIQSHVLSLSG